MKTLRNITSALLSAAILLIVATAANATDGTWVGVNGKAAGLWSDTAMWDSGIIADGVGAVADFPTNWHGTSNYYVTEIDSNRTLGAMTSNAYVMGYLKTTNGAKLTWDTGDPNVNALYQHTGNFLTQKDERDMVLVSDLEYILHKQRGRPMGGEGVYISGTISGTGKMIYDIGSLNGDLTNFLRFDITGNSPNTYSGGTDIAMHGRGTYGQYAHADAFTVYLMKDGALGTGDVNMTHIDGNLRVTAGGTDRISDTAALSLISGYDEDYHMRAHGYMRTDMEMEAGVSETVNALYMNGFQAPAGIYNSTTNPLWFKDDNAAAGCTGDLIVTTGPAATSQTSADDGNWTADATWGGTAPSYFDEAAVGNAVTVAANAGANNVTMTAGGSITINAGQKLNVQRTFDPTGGSVTINGTLETLTLASTTGVTLGPNSTLTVGNHIVVDNDFDISTANKVQLPGSFTGNMIEITESGTLTVVDMIDRVEALKVDGTLKTTDHILFQYGGRLTGNGVIDLEAGRYVQMSLGNEWTARGNGGLTLAPGDDGVGTLTIKNGYFQIDGGKDAVGAFGLPKPKTYIEWEIGQGETDVLSVVEGGQLFLYFSDADATENGTQFTLLDANGYVASVNDKLDVFTYDDTSTIYVETNHAGIVQGVDADDFNVDDLIANGWTIGTIQLRHEAYPGGGGHVYITGIAGGTMVPEPSSLILLATGALGLLLRTRRRR